MGQAAVTGVAAIGLLVTTIMPKLVGGGDCICSGDHKSKSDAFVTQATCPGVNVSTIPDLAGRLPTSLVCGVGGKPALLERLFDTSATRKCLKGKRLCMLGDSELEETMHDILVLLSGIGADVSRVLDYYRQMSTPLHADVPEHVVFNDVAINFTGKWGPKFGPWLRSHRITEATCPSIGFSLHHRFTGHRVVYENGEGVAGLLYYLKSEEARAVELASCDIFVLNSASHDFLACRASHGLEVLSKDEHGVAKACLDSHLERLAQALAAAAANSSTLFGPSAPPPVPSSSASPPPPPPLLLRKQFAYWKGGNFEAMGGAQPSGFLPIDLKRYWEQGVASLLSSSNASAPHYVNLTSAFEQLPLIRHARFMHIGQNADHDAVNASLLWTNVATQRLLQHICAGAE